MFLVKCIKCNKEWIYGCCVLDIGIEIKQVGPNQFQVICGKCTEKKENKIINIKT